MTGAELAHHRTALAAAIEQAAFAETRLYRAIDSAREAGMSWRSIATVIGLPPSTIAAGVKLRYSKAWIDSLPSKRELEAMSEF